jgi:hypothetical protein
MSQQIRVSQETHGLMKQVSDKHGMKISALVDLVCKFWIDGEVFILPKTVPCGKPSPPQPDTKSATPK